MGVNRIGTKKAWHLRADDRVVCGEGQFLNRYPRRDWVVRTCNFEGHGCVRLVMEAADGSGDVFDRVVPSELMLDDEP
jgi:hypothetical protein